MINIEKLEKKVLETLEASGWNKNRCVKIDKQMEILRKEGYVPFDYANEIIKSFDGIYIARKRIWSKIIYW